MKKLYLGILMLFLSVIVFAGQVIPLPDLQKPENIIVDKNQILITEFPYVYIYDLKTLKLVKKFGKAGEGPREFFNYVRIQYDPKYPDYICVGSHMKMSYYTRKGEFVKEIRSKTSSTANVYKPVGKKNFAAYGFVQEEKTVYNTLNLFDENLKKIKEIARWEQMFQQGKSLNPTDTDLQGGQFRIYDDKIYLMFREDGTIEVFDENGEKLYDVKYEYERVPVTSEDKKAIHEHFKTDPRFSRFYELFTNMVKFPSYWPSTIDHIVANDKIYVLTNKKVGEKSEIVIFDKTGNFYKKIMIPVKFANPRETYPLTINYGKLFQLYDNEDTEEWELHINAIN